LLINLQKEKKNKYFFTFNVGGEKRAKTSISDSRR
jgi:hypothetical protein